MTSHTQSGEDLCTLALGDQNFGVATDSVFEALAQCVIRPVPLAPQFVAGILAFRGEALLAVSLRAVLGMPEHPEAACGIVMRDTASGELYAILVDQVLDVERVETSDWEGNPRTLASHHADVFAGVYRRSGAPLIKLAPEQLQPSALAARWSVKAHRAERGNL